MAGYKASSSRPLFLELVLDVAIFAICAVICLQVFAQAHLESNRSAVQSQLGIEAQKVAELFKGGYNDPESLAALLHAQRCGNTLNWYYDQDFKPTTITNSESYYVITCVIDDSQVVKVARITLVEGQTNLLELVVSSYTLSGGPIGGVNPGSDTTEENAAGGNAAGGNAAGGNAAGGNAAGGGGS